jgi:hypothetical protein
METGERGIGVSSKLFKDLSESIKEAGKIRRGEKKPSRVFEKDPKAAVRAGLIPHQRSACDR